MAKRRNQLASACVLIALTLAILIMPQVASWGAPSYPQLDYVPVDHSGETSARFAVIGDYGRDTGAESDVAALVRSWNPDFIITVGDNNYWFGAASTIDGNVGKYYAEFISPYSGKHQPLTSGPSVNRFLPILGNHDWMTKNAKAYLRYFTLPGNERYYDFVWGPVHFFALDSDGNEPDGVTADSVQAMWLKSRLAASDSPWKIVYLHHPPYSSGQHGSSVELRWPYREWGASAVLSGHEHDYERIDKDGFPYFINGVGGGSLTGFSGTTSGSQVQFNDDYGAMLVEADADGITFQFFTRGGRIIDTYTIRTAKGGDAGGGSGEL